MYGSLCRRSKRFPSLLEAVEVLESLGDGLWRPINNQVGWPLDARYVVRAEGLFLCSPLPKAIAQRADAIGVSNKAGDKQQRHNSQRTQAGQWRFLSSRESVYPKRIAKSDEAQRSRCHSRTRRESTGAPRSPTRTPDFLSSLLVLAHFMRLSLMKAAHAGVGGAPCRKSGYVGRK
jgi:hypothetical protein